MREREIEWERERFRGRWNKAFGRQGLNISLLICGKKCAEIKQLQSVGVYFTVRIEWKSLLKDKNNVQRRCVYVLKVTKILCLKNKEKSGLKFKQKKKNYKTLLYVALRMSKIAW